jgi:hypothetical protein
MVPAELLAYRKYKFCCPIVINQMRILLPCCCTDESSPAVLLASKRDIYGAFLAYSRPEFCSTANVQQVGVPQHRWRGKENGQIHAVLLVPDHGGGGWRK